MQRYFEQAQKAEQPLERQQANDQAEGRGSQMVKDDRPQPELKPSPEMARGQDRESFDSKWSSEQDAARKAYMERYQSQTDHSRSEPERNRDLENGM